MIIKIWKKIMNFFRHRNQFHWRNYGCICYRLDFSVAAPIHNKHTQNKHIWKISTPLASFFVIVSIRKVFLQFFKKKIQKKNPLEILESIRYRNYLPYMRNPPFPKNTTFSQNMHISQNKHTFFDLTKRCLLWVGTE